MFANGYWLLVLSRCIAGIGAGTFAPVSAAVAGSLVQKHKKGRALGVILGGIGTSTVVGVPFGIQLSNYAGWQSALLVVAIVGAAAVVGIINRLPVVEVAPSLSSRLQMLPHPRVAIVVSVTPFTAIASLGLYTFMAPMLASLNLVIGNSFYFWALGIGGVVGAFSVGHLIDRSGRPGIVLLVILALMTREIAVVTFTPNPPIALTFVPFLIWEAMGWSSLASRQHVLLDLQPEHGSIAVALNSSANYLGSAIGTMVGGSILAGQSIGASGLPEFTVGAGLLALLIQIVILARHLNAHRAPRLASNH